jgi:putative membrane protein
MRCASRLARAFFAQQGVCEISVNRPWFHKPCKTAGITLFRRGIIDRPGGVVMQLQLIAALIIVFLIVVFAVQNAVAVSVIFFLWRVDASLATLVATCFGLGILIGALLTVPTMLRERLSISRLRKQVEALRAENDNLREPKKHASSAASDF